MKKKLGLIIFILGIFFTSQIEAKNINNNHYIYYRGLTCGHCANVESYREKSNINIKEIIDIELKEVQNNRENSNEMLERGKTLGLSINELGTPFLVITTPKGNTDYLMGDTPIINYTKQLESEYQNLIEGNINNETIKDILNETNINNQINNQNNGKGNNESLKTNEKQNESLKDRLKFLAIMMPAALSDSINPCAFAVMLLLLTAILSKTRNKRKALYSGLSFSLAVFITYFLLGIGTLKLLGNLESLKTLKWIVGIVGILVGLANLKDFFRYGEGFVMEVPYSWRPKMEKIIKKTTSPFGAFIIGVIISLFLLPCSSGPYLTILGYLSAENQTLTTRGYIYLTIYNIIFVLPMIIIALLVGLGYSTAEKIGALKNKNTKLIHLIVGLLMIGLGIYVIGSIFWR